MEMRLTLAVDNLDITQRFYSNFLELPGERLQLAAPYGEILLINGQDICLAFRSHQDLAQAHPAVFASRERHPKGLGMTLEFPHMDMPRLQRKLQRQPQRVIYELESQQHGLQEIWLYDPDNYLLILSHSSQI